MNFILNIGGKNKIRFCFLGSGSRFGFVRIFSDPHHWSGLWPHTVQHRNVSMYSWRIMPREIDLHQSDGSLKMELCHVRLICTNQLAPWRWNGVTWDWFAPIRWIPEDAMLSREIDLQCFAPIRWIPERWKNVTWDWFAPIRWLPEDGIMSREIDLHQSAGSLHTVHSPNNILPSRRIEVLVVFRTWRTIESCVQFLSLMICCRRSDDGYLYCPVRTSSSKSRGKKLTWLIKFVLKKLNWK